MRLLPSGASQVIEELFTYWNLDDADETLEELEDALIVRQAASRWQPRAQLCVVVVGCGWASRVCSHWMAYHGVQWQSTSVL